ncbi:MAG: hypothetical protein HQ522_08740 [Bacteroidetes bacterium]|nr:hypothetical protein [Bacteroidota bacterium]
MKKISTFLFLALIAISGFAQAPEGIIYQAEARDNTGRIIENETLDVKITILENDYDGVMVWEGLHSVTTNKFGMFVLVIGEGTNTYEYQFEEINWGNHTHFLNVRVKKSETEDWIDMGTTQFLSVPYALHAKTADALVPNANSLLKSAGPGVSSQAWSLFGNSKSDPEKDKIGTTDPADLIFVTDNIERLRITKDGKLITADGVGLELGGNLKVHGDSVNVDKDLFVGRNAYFNVDENFDPQGETINYGNFSVENNSATHLTGTLTVDGETDLNSDFRVNNSSATGLSGTLTVDGITNLNSALNVNGATTIQNTLNVTGNSTVNRLNANGQVTIDATLGDAEGTYGNYPLQVQCSQQGIAIKLSPTSSAPERGNNYVSFWDGNGIAKGRIEGMDGVQGFGRSVVTALIGGLPDFDDAFDMSDDENQGGQTVAPGAYFNNDYAFGALSVTLDFVNSIIKFGVNVVGASGLCLSGDCDDVVWSAVDMLVNGIQLGSYVAYNEINKGVAFESGGADYAEWLMKNKENEVFAFGDVVGVKGGLISKEFKKAEKYMVISKDPTVIGAMPNEADRKKFEKIAFMGQVPVKVIGKVKKGDYILPSGNQDGMAIAVSPNTMAAMDYSRIIGIAWGESDGKKLFEYVNIAVGINSNDMAGLIENMQSLINDMQVALAQVVPDFQPQLYAVNGNSSINSNQITTSQSLQDIVGNKSSVLQYSSLDEALLKAKEYGELQNFDFSQYPYLAEVFENPSPELAEQMVAHYSEVLNKITAIMGGSN